MASADTFPSLILPSLSSDLSRDLSATSSRLSPRPASVRPLLSVRGPTSVSPPIFLRLIQFSQEAEETLIQCEPGQTHVVCDGRDREVVRKKIRDALVSCLSKF